jgi:hypothetical protein
VSEESASLKPRFGAKARLTFLSLALLGSP